jgi:hypothetical protein
MQPHLLAEQTKEELVEAARRVVGNDLRSVTYLTQDTVEQLYLRDYLEADADLESFAEAERSGFDDRMEYKGTELGPFQFTIRVFKRGYLVRAIADGHGAFVTLDAVDREQFDELGEALLAVLETLESE